MRELNFLRDQKLHDSWQHVQWNFIEDVENAVEGQVSHYLNKVLRIEADLQLRADPYERTLERLDYRAGYRARSLTMTKGAYELRVPKALFAGGTDRCWDLLINDDDGLGREGALQLASSVWGIEESAVGAIRGIGSDE